MWNSIDSRTGTVLGADAAWVVASAAVLVGFPELLTVAGRWFFAAVGLVVGDLAVFEWLGLRRHEQATSALRNTPATG